MSQISRKLERGEKLKKLSKIRLWKILYNFYTIQLLISLRNLVLRLLLMANNRIVNKSCLQVPDLIKGLLWDYQIFEILFTSFTPSFWLNKIPRFITKRNPSLQGFNLVNRSRIHVLLKHVSNYSLRFLSSWFTGDELVFRWVNVK